MAVTDLNLIGMLKTKMKWHQARQKVLADNVANADTPRFQPSDLKPLDGEILSRVPRSSNLSTLRTNAAHFAVQSSSSFGSRFGASGTQNWEVTPEGNGVVLEEQMIKVAGNQFDYQLASTLYKRSLGLIKTALGKQA